MESITESKLETGSSSMYAEELTSSSSSELLSRFLHGANTNGLVKTHVFDEISVIKEEEVEKKEPEQAATEEESDDDDNAIEMVISDTTTTDKDNPKAEVWYISDEDNDGEGD